MPQLQVTTKSSEQVWKSPDGQRVIHKLMLDYNGSEVQAKTYSNDIAKTGWTGTVETYEKAGRNGSETFVKQPQKEGGYQPQGGGGGAKSYGGGKPQDNFTMFLSYAKDLVVAHVTAQTKDGAKLSLDDSVAATLQYGIQLYEGRPDAPKTPEVTPEKSELDNVFGETEVIEEEAPWTEPPQLPVS